MTRRHLLFGILMRLPPSLTQSACAAALAVMAIVLPLRPALAAEYTDLWITPGEDAWGVNFVQWGSIIYATFYIYGPDKKPVWYTAVLNYDGASKFSGTLFSTQGTYFALPWNPSDIVDGIPSGTATFQPSTSNNYQGSLVYMVNGVGTITKAIQRLTVAAIPLGGTYVGGQVNLLFRLQQQRCQWQSEGLPRLTGDTVRGQQCQHEFRLHVGADMHAGRYAVAERPVVRCCRRYLQVLGRTQYQRRGIRSQGNCTGNRRPILRTLRRRRLQGRFEVFSHAELMPAPRFPAVAARIRTGPRPLPPQR